MTREEIMRIATGLLIDFKCESNTMVDFCNTIIKELGTQPCEDCVSRAEVLEMIERIHDAGGFIGYNTYSEAFDRVDNLPSITPSQKKGKWIKGITQEKFDYFGDRVQVADYTCSVCGRVIKDIGLDSDSFTNKLDEYPYCHCGAKMECEE